MKSYVSRLKATIFGCSHRSLYPGGSHTVIVVHGGGGLAAHTTARTPAAAGAGARHVQRILHTHPQVPREAFLQNNKTKNH